MLDKIYEVVRKFDLNAKTEVIKEGKLTKVRVKSSKYCDKARIWIFLNEMFKDRDDVIIEVE